MARTMIQQIKTVYEIIKRMTWEISKRVEAHDLHVIEYPSTRDISEPQVTSRMAPD